MVSKRECILLEKLEGINEEVKIMTASINFELHRVIIDVDSLIKIRSSYYNVNEQWQELVDKGVTRDNCILRSKITYNQTALWVGNFCFAESVFSNPINDLKEYQVWKDGIRHFPFSGKYFRLGLQKQGQKKASESVKGTLGEIIGGLFFNTQATTMVRSIQRYPDFIGTLSSGRGWSFLEAKCYEKPLSPIFNKRVPLSEFKDLCLKAVAEFKDDKSLLFYASFTRIDKYSPLELSQTIVEISDVNRESALMGKIKVPDAYMDQVVEACVVEAIYELSEDFSKLKPAERKIRGDSIEDKIYERTVSKLKEVEKSSNLNHGELSKDRKFHKTISNKIKDILSKTTNKKSTILKDITSGKSIDFISVPNNPSFKKMVKGTEINEEDAIYTQLIDESDVSKIGSTKSKNWELKSLKRGKETFYLIGNSYVGIGDKDSEPPIIDKFEESDWS